MRAARLLQAVMLGLFTAVGLVATVATAADWLQGLDTWFWEESTCRIESSEAVERPQYGDFEFQVSYRYRHRGESYLGDAYSHDYGGSEERSEAETLASRYLPGSELRCWVDPDEPGRSYLRRSDLSRGFWILVPLLFVAVGGGALWLVYGVGSRREEEKQPTRDGSPKKAKAGIGVGLVIVFFGIFFLFGAGFLIPVFIRPALQVVEARSWTQMSCEVVSSKVRTHPGDDGATYSVDALFRYEIDGREYRSNRYQFMGGSTSGNDRKARIVESLPPGASTICYVDPDDPFEAVIERGFTGDYLFGLVPLIFALFGIGGLVFVIGALRKARRDAARPSWAAPTDPGDSYASAWSSPESAETPGSRPMILEPARGAVGKLGCAVTVALFWNGFISIFVWQIAQQWKEGNPDWFSTIILTPFAAIGLLLLFSIPYSILALLNPRPRVHLSPGAIRPGETAQLEWAFRGFGSRIRRLRIWLAATETRTRVDGSSVRIETEALDTPSIEVLDRGRELPLEYGAVSFTVPDDTPPSRKAEPSVEWRLKLHGEIAYWPDVNEEYPVRVLPERG